MLQLWADYLDTARFLEFLSRLIEGATRKIFLVVDNLRVDHAKRISEWLQGKQDRIELVFLPPHAPDRILMNISIGTAKQHCRAALPHHVASYFKHPAAIYADQGVFEGRVNK